MSKNYCTRCGLWEFIGAYALCAKCLNRWYAQRTHH